MGKKSKRSNYQRIDLGIYSGINFLLVVPSKWNKSLYPLHYLEYYNGKQVKYYTEVKSLYQQYLPTLTRPNVTEQEKITELQRLYSYDIGKIISSLDLKASDDINLNTLMNAAVDIFFQYQESQYAKGELNNISNYKDRTAKLKDFFRLDNNKHLMLRDLTSDIWEAFRNYLLGTKKLKKSTVNQYMTYVSQFYNFLIFKEIAIFNHSLKLKKLDASKQEKKFKEIKDDVLKSFFQTLEANKFKYTRIYLSALLIYEQTIRPIQLCSIKVSQLDLTNNLIKDIYSAKNKSYRSIIISPKVKELIEIVLKNTSDSGIDIEPQDYLIGGRDRLKKGIPYTPKDVRRVFDVFKREFPQFKEVLIYDFKKTSITNQFNDATIAPDLIRQRANHSKMETTQIYNQKKDVTAPFILQID
ncbi:tyrosine-type recombinase/integrase [Pedobacter cryotolerans]|uniref:Site-specific integrase n=1 Tax=Pedobacter cryotolerans TaxID=2571270 RepID=A0A4U1BUX3_9SPHI|nr:site-specific integrase [Pedobacter cryotolerans]TKB96532.1 site-specific integrase [Pedobacter cryotolerans]